MSNYPFHFAFFVKDLKSTRDFYGRILGCKEGRSTDTWVDFDFFGNQISAHITEEMPQTRNTGKVDGIAVPMPHFGCIIPWNDFQNLVGSLRKAQVKFIIEPRIRYANQVGEQETMFLTDFSGNAIEIKCFKNPDDMFAS